MIIVKNLHHIYPGEIRALKGVSLRIKDGEFVAIMGENGAGKTTLVKHLNKLLSPTKGKVIIDNEDLAKHSVASISRKVGFVFQNPSNQLFCRTVEEEIEFGLKNFGFKQKEIKKTVEVVLKKLNLCRFKKNSPFELSEGERKKIAIACAISWNPSTLIFDEPTIAQDYEQKSVLQKIIKQLLKEKKTIIMVTHDIEFVAELKPRVILMSNGFIVGDGPAEKILTNKKLIEKSSLIMPHIAQVFDTIRDKRIKRRIVNVVDADQELSKFIGGKK